MTTDTSEKGLETLIVRHMTGTDGLHVAPSVMARPPAPYGGTGYFAGAARDYDRAHALDVPEQGRYPNFAHRCEGPRLTGHQAQHIRDRGFNKQYYLDAIEALIREHQPVPRLEIDRLLMDKLPEVLSESQKKAKIHNLIAELPRKGKIENRGSRGQPAWHTIDNKPGV